MGRPKTHDQHVAAELLDSAERIVQAGGLEQLTVRRLAHDVGTTTRAIYSLFGSKDGLIVALGARAFRLLGDAIDELPATSDPAADLVAAGVTVFRRFAIDHPALFQIGVQQTLTAPAQAAQFRAAADDALQRLNALVARLQEAGLLGTRSVPQASLEFHALCEGLAALEMRCVFPAGHGEQIWRAALTAIVSGFAAAPSQPARIRLRTPTPGSEA